MFEAKKKTLFAVDNSKSASKSAFIQAGLKTAAETTTGNGGKAYSSTGDPFVDQFGRHLSTEKFVHLQKLQKTVKFSGQKIKKILLNLSFSCE